MVCRHNKARSPFAEAVIKYHFPQFSVQSFGTEPTDGEPTSEFAQAIAQAQNIIEIEGLLALAHGQQEEQGAESSHGWD